MKELILMMGVPGSGKSTYARNILKYGDIYISRDEIRYSMLTDEDRYFAKENEVIKTFIQYIDEALIETQYQGKVYADATHLSPKGRAQVLNQLKNKDKVSVIYLDIPLNVILKRNAQREGRALVPENVVRRMYNSIILPTRAEGIEKLIIIDENQEVKEVREL
jgi:predicted kinase